MRYPKIIVVFCLITALASCRREQPGQQKYDAVVSDTAASAVTNSKIGGYNNSFPPAKELVTNIVFEEFTLTLDSTSTYDESLLKGLQQQDSVTVCLDIGESFLGKKIRISGEGLSNIIVAERYETSAGISIEDRACELADWKHYYSDWEVLKPNNDGSYISKNYTLAESRKFPKVTPEEFRKAVLEGCGSAGADIIKNEKKPGDNASEVGISRIFLRVTAIDENGKTITKIITFSIIWGC
jgi:hypothetical protein